MSSKFNLSGETYTLHGKWGAKIFLNTPDGKQTTLDSEAVYSCDSEAANALKLNLDRILTEFKKDGVEVIERNGVKYQ